MGCSSSSTKEVVDKKEKPAEEGAAAPAEEAAPAAEAEQSTEAAAEAASAEEAAAAEPATGEQVEEKAAEAEVETVTAE